MVIYSCIYTKGIKFKLRMIIIVSVFQCTLMINLTFNPYHDSSTLITLIYIPAIAILFHVLCTYIFSFSSVSSLRLFSLLIFSLLALSQCLVQYAINMRTLTITSCIQFLWKVYTYIQFMYITGQLARQ